MRFLSLLIRDRPDEELRPALRRPKKVARVMAALAILAGVLLLAAPRFDMAPVDIPKKGPIHETVRARFAFRVEDQERTEAKWREKRNEVGKIYVFDNATTQVIAKDIDALVNATNQFETENKGRSPEDRADYSELSDRVRNDTGIHVSSNTLRILSGEIRSAGFRSAMRDLFRQFYGDTVVVKPGYADDYYTRAVRIEDRSGMALRTDPFHPSRTTEHPEKVRLALRRKKYLSRFYPMAEVPDERAAQDALLALVVKLVRVNLAYSPDRTKKAEEQALAKFKPEFQTFEEGKTIIEGGTVPSALERQALETYNKRIRYYRLARLSACLALALGMVLFLLLYARRFRPMMGFRTKTIVLVGIPQLVVLGVGRVWMTLLGGRYDGLAGYDPAGYLFPTALIGMLGVILLDTELAILLALMGSVLVGLATNLSFHHALVALFGGLAGVASLHNLRERGQIIRGAVLIAVVNTLAIGVLRFIAEPSQIYYAAAIWGPVNALVLAYPLAIAMFPIFERVFGVATDLRLLELTGVQNDLLRQVEENAPGTYQHSLNVAKLAEAGADAIGANYLLVRAGAYFHDVGKALKPRYFSENQISSEERRVHEKLTPYMSCLIIRNHVKEGIEVARRAGLPEQVIDFIPQHHGTCLIKFFYHAAIRQYEESESAEPVREEDFRYPGPKPQTVEAAIVMVADSVEATATSRLNRPRIDEDDIRRLVRDTIQDKFSDGQFDECHLTLRQLHEIREAMVRTLVGRFHHRIDYPAAPDAPAKLATKEPAAVA